MYYNWNAKEVIRIHKQMFENAYNYAVTVNDFNQKLADTFCNRAVWYPREARETVNQWREQCEQSRNNFKQMVDNTFDQLIKSA